jgi:hypothetical protein
MILENAPRINFTVTMSCLDKAVPYLGSCSAISVLSISNNPLLWQTCAVHTTNERTISAQQPFEIMLRKTSVAHLFILFLTVLD